MIKYQDQSGSHNVLVTYEIYLPST